MEVIKRNCFSMMIEKRNVEPEKFVTVMKDLEKQVRECYEEPLDRFDSDTFVEMMILDGCFIVLLFEEDTYLRTCLHKLKEGIEQEILCDLLLLENQLPFFVLFDLYNVINMSNDVEIDEFPRLAFSLLSEVIPEPGLCVPEKLPNSKEIKHLLDLVHHSWLHVLEAKAEAKERKGQRLWKFICCRTKPKKKGIRRKGKRKCIRCATELEETGIKFVKIGEEEQDKKGKESLFDIDFTDDGKLKIPILSVEDNTERLLRNFMVYEHFLHSKPTYVCDYVVLMDNLMNSGKDVQLLRKRGIINNWLGDDEVVAQMFNKLGDFTCTSVESNDFYYAEIYDKVHNHCERRRNKWKAKFHKLYLNSPWSIISVLAAFVLLLLTGVQAVYSVLSYHHPK
ncbi:hypothetical protein CRYUN_Cryun05aG0049100 [Craigia yunnanensis]